MSRVVVAGGSRIAADAGAAVADKGGNAVDAAIAAAVASMSTDPGIIALGAGAFVTVAPPGEEPIVVDGYVEMPGRAADAGRFGTGTAEIHMEYGGGITTGVGHGSVATPGAIAAFGMVSECHGALRWPELLEPARHWAETGFPLSGAAAEYLSYSHELIFGWHPESHAVFHHDDGTPRREGETIHCPGLADSLAVLGDEGPSAFYTGTIGRQMAADSEANGGLLGLADLEAYEPTTRRPLVVDLDDWRFHTVPGPAIGGAAVAAFLTLIRGVKAWDADGTATIARALEAVLQYRLDHLDGNDDREPALRRLMELAEGGDPARLLSSPSTIHVSAVDDDGRACSISASSGYGSGVVVPGTGIWLNNSLGESDLLRTELHEQEPGTRLPSNMAPSIARHRDGSVLAIGSPGASRITSAVAEVMFNHLHLDMSLEDAIAHPRLHVEQFEGEPTLAHEPGLDLSALQGLTPRPFDGLSMYFGGTHAARWDPHEGLTGAADPRRRGGVAFGGA